MSDSQRPRMEQSWKAGEWVFCGTEAERRGSPGPGLRYKCGGIDMIYYIPSLSSAMSSTVR